MRIDEDNILVNTHKEQVNGVIEYINIPDNLFCLRDGICARISENDKSETQFYVDTNLCQNMHIQLWYIQKAIIIDVINY